MGVCGTNRVTNPDTGTGVYAVAGGVCGVGPIKEVLRGATGLRGGSEGYRGVGGDDTRLGVTSLSSTTSTGCSPVGWSWVGTGTGLRATTASE